MFNPNACGNHCPEDLGRFINDQIARTLAGVVGKGKPIFLKIPYHGPEAMEQLASYDRTLIPGILGGSSGTTFDAFFQLWEAKKYGARAALYGRMINNSEHQASFIQHLRWLADGDLNDPEEAVRSYHAALQNNGVQPYRSIEDDLISTRRLAAYGNTTASPTTPNASTTPTRDPIVEKIPQNEKVKWSLDRWQRVLG